MHTCRPLQKYSDTRLVSMVILSTPVLITTFCNSIRQGLTYLLFDYTYSISSEEKYWNPSKNTDFYTETSEPSLEALQILV